MSERRLSYPTMEGGGHAEPPAKSAPAQPESPRLVYGEGPLDALDKLDDHFDPNAPEEHWEQHAGEMLGGLDDILGRETVESAYEVLKRYADPTTIQRILDHGMEASPRLIKRVLEVAGRTQGEVDNPPHRDDRATLEYPKTRRQFRDATVARSKGLLAQRLSRVVHEEITRKATRLGGGINKTQPRGLGWGDEEGEGEA